MKKQSKLKYKILGLGLALTATGTAVGLTTMLYKPTDNKNMQAAYQSEWSDPSLGKTMLGSPSFDIGASTSVGGSSLSTNLLDWKPVRYDANSRGMIISVNDYTFNTNQSNFALKENPGKRGSDNHVLMINSLTSDKDTPHYALRGYQSKSFTLSKNSYYKISIDAMTSLDGYQDVNEAYASIYLNGIKDDNGKELKFAYEGISGGWKTYNFFIATGKDDQTVTLDLYLGRSDNDPSYGVAFFDEAKIEQFSHNAFISTCLTTGEYDFEDNYDTTKFTTNKFMISQFAQTQPKLMEKYKNYNFDFEKEEVIDSFGKNSNWKVVANSTNAKARIMKLTSDGQYTFEEKTGYSFPGNDYSYDIKNKKENEHGLVLYTEKNKNAYFAVETVNSIDIEAHAVYKISMKVKFSEMSNGAFYVNVVESDEDALLSKYGLKKGDITMQSGSTSGISTNTTSKANNDYTEISFYVKGRTFYDSKVKLQLALGTSSANASGCVVIDSIKVEYAPTSETTSASNFLDLGTITDSSSSNFKNRFFNNTEVTTEEFSYPLTATNWTTEQESGKNVTSGILYLENEDHYNRTYKDYDWATSYPGNPRGSDAANNLFMFYNGEEAYQSITSEDVTLAKDSYYGITFDYKIASASKKAPLTVEVVDNNNITLFKEPIYSVVDNTWNSTQKIDIYFHTALTSAHTVKVIIHFGENEQGKLVEGTAYIDNFNLYTSDDFAFNYASENHGYTVDLTDYMLNLGHIGYNLSDANAYKFDAGTSGNAVGGIVDGKSNEFGVENENNLLVLSAKRSPSTSSLTSKFNFDLSDQYYKLTFSLMTISGLNPHEEEKDHECKYGVSVGLSGFETVSDLISEDEFTTFTIYIYASSSQTSTLTYSLVMDKHSWGSAYLTDIKLEKLEDSSEYEDASKDEENFGKTVFTSKITNTSDPSTPEENPSDKAEYDPTNWIVIPSIITAIAVIIAIVGWLLRKIKIKKIERIKQESYDREITLNDEVILAQAVKERDAEAELIKKSLDDMQNQKQLLEDDHKEMIKASRLSQNGKVTKQTEHEFKSYTSKINRLEEKIEILQEHLAKVESADYLISLQRQIEADEIKRQREAIRAKEKELKEQEKAEKKVKKSEKKEN